MSLSKQQLDKEKVFCIAELKKLDLQAYEMILNDAEAADTVWTFVISSLEVEDRLTSSPNENPSGEPTMKDSIVVVVKALEYETFQVKVDKKKNTHSEVTFKRTENGRQKEFLSPIKLLTAQSAETATYRQASSIMIEIIVVLLSILNINFTLSLSELEDAVEQLMPYMGMIGEALRNLAYTWKHTSHMNTKALAIITFLRQVYHAGVLTNSIKIVIGNMSLVERVKTLICAIAFIRKVCRNPQSLIERIETALQHGAERFMVKIDTLYEINEIHAELDISYVL